MAPKKNYNWIWQTAIALVLSAIVAYYTGQAQTSDSINTVKSDCTKQVDDVDKKLEVHIAAEDVKDENTKDDIDEMKDNLGKVVSDVADIKTKQAVMQSNLQNIIDIQNKILEAVNKNGG